MSTSLWWPHEVTINVEYDDVIGQIPTDVLEEELKARKELQHSNIKEFEREESKRCGGIDIGIDPSDYDLTNEEDVSLSDFTDEQIIDYLERKREYIVVSKDETFGTLENVIKFVYTLPNHKFRDFICDILGISRRSTYKQIIEEINNRI